LTEDVEPKPKRIYPPMLPPDALADLQAAVALPDYYARLQAIDRARSRAVYNYPHLFKKER